MTSRTAPLPPLPLSLMDRKAETHYYAKLAVREALERAAQVCETAPDLLQNSTFDGAAAAIRAMLKEYE